MQPFRSARRVDTPGRALHLDTAAKAQRNVVSTWITSPLAAAAFVPRIYAGTLAKGPAVVSEIAESIGDANSALQNSTLTTGEKTASVQEMLRNILNKQLDGLLVRGTQVEMELFGQVDAVIDTSMIRPEYPQPLEQPPEEPAQTPIDPLQTVDLGAGMPYTMPTAQSRSASALLQLQDAITGIQAALALIETNETPSRAAMLKLSMKESWETLRSRVVELESMPVDGVEGAVAEARALVTEVESAFNFS